ncbi:TRAP transporter large permease subunit [Acidisphaera sp. S103]|uniref:TRAP transporter large permease n=1 Tax=Acidisphaera sp. S103 TaxID=1747223 RepID=UPI0020B1733F|nr:TRAP transporter large permease subunit [Acidisphaera sp. S103]
MSTAAGRAVASADVISLAIERVLERVAGLLAAVLVLAEVVTLLLGVIFRYVLQNPLGWTNELASALFLWLAMLGSVIAWQRGQHMCLTAVVARFTPHWRARAEAIVAAAGATFLLLLTPASLDYTGDQWAIVSPSLGLHDALRTAAFPIAGLMMLFTALARLLRLGWRDAGFGIITVASVWVLFSLGGDALADADNWNLLVFFVLLLGAGVLLSVPIAFAFGLATFAYLDTVTSTPFTVVVARMDDGMSSLILLAVPLFVLLGMLVEMTGMARAMVAFLAALLGHVRGGLNYVLLGAMYLVAGISGSKSADMAAVVPVLFPEMLRRGSDEGELVSLLAASGAMCETIPPSLVLITVGSVTGVSIAALFSAGLLPAAVLAVALAVIARHRVRHDNTAGVERARLPAIMKALTAALPALVLPFVIRGAVISGIATATEVSTIGIVYSVVVGLLIYRSFDLRRLYPMLVDTASLSGAILLIVGAATAMAWALTQSGFSQQLSRSMATTPGGAFGFLAISIVAFIVLGSVLEGIPAMVLFGPLLFPQARAIGINEVHYAIVVILAMGIGLFAPPFGVGYYSACAIARVSPDAAMRRIWAYLLAVLVGLLVVAALPWISVGSS